MASKLVVMWLRLLITSLRQQPFSYVAGWGARIFIVLLNCFPEPSSVKVFFFSWERKQNICFLSCGTETTRLAMSQINSLYHFSCNFFCSIWKVKLYWLDNFLLYAVTGWNIAYLVPLLHVLPVEFCETSCKSVHLLLRENIRRGNHGMIVTLFFVSKYKCWWGKKNVIFLQEKHNIHEVS